MDFWAGETALMFGAGIHLLERLFGAYHDLNQVGLSPSL